MFAPLAFSCYYSTPRSCAFSSIPFEYQHHPILESPLVHAFTLDSKRKAPLRRGAQSSAPMPPPSRPGAVGRASIRAGSTTRAPSVRPQSAATVTSRFDRSGAASRAETASSTRASPAAGMKRKERDFETDFNVETNITVVVRCRGRSEREVGENSAVVVKTNGVMGQHVELSMGSNALSNKTYAFDRVFSQAADQSMVFDDVVKPILGDVS